MKKTVSFKFAMALCCVLALAGCTKKSSTGLLEDPAGTSAGQAAPGSEQDFALNAGDRIYFEEDQSTLTAEAQETLKRQAQWLQQYQSVSIQVEGHADERGTREYNIALSARRATTAREFLIAQGVEASRVASIAYGKERPAALCDAEQCWSQNRRAVSVITAGAKTS